MDKFSLNTLIKIAGFLAVFVFAVLMLSTIKQYTSFQTDVGFLKFKQSVVSNKYWLFFFYVHIFSIVICLLAGLTQFSNQLLNQFRKTHKILGKIYVYNILLINFPACFILAYFSNGGILGISGFIFQNLLWGYFTVAAIISIKKQKISEHKNYMILSFAITTTALTFRIIKNVFYTEDQFAYQLFYGITVWLALLINLAIAFIIIQKKAIKLPLERKLTDENSK